MKALNAAPLTPLSVLCDRRKQPRKSSSLPRICACKLSDSASFPSKKPSLNEYLPAGLRGGLLLAASVINGGIAKALTYEEALGKFVGSPTSFGDLDVNGVIDSVISFGTENAVIIAGGLAILGVPLVLSQVLNKPKPWGVESAKNAYAKLGADGDAQLLDIRAPSEFRQVGTPDVGGLRKKALSITYRADDKPGFLKKLALKFKKPENTTLFILDK